MVVTCVTGRCCPGVASSTTFFQSYEANMLVIDATFLLATAGMEVRQTLRIHNCVHTRLVELIILMAIFYREHCSCNECDENAGIYTNNIDMHYTYKIRIIANVLHHGI